MVGNRLPPVPVEIRGRSIEGVISEGDQVEIPGVWREGETLRTTLVRNKTTGAVVKCKDTQQLSRTIKIIIIMILILFLAFAWFVGLSGFLANTSDPLFSVPFLIVPAIISLIAIIIAVSLLKRKQTNDNA